jgi:hypothetical protein
MIAHDQDRRPSEDDGPHEDLVEEPASSEEPARAPEAYPDSDEVGEYIRAQMEEAEKWLTE